MFTEIDIMLILNIYLRYMHNFYSYLRYIV